MYILASNMWFTTVVRQFFFMIDKVVYNFIPAIYDLLISIARTSVLSQGDIMQIANRIYTLLAVFMVFKVTFSLIMYVVNPDDFSSQTKGVSKLGLNVVISLALLVLTPYLFKYAYQFQTKILEDNSIATLVFGDKTEDSFFNTAGQNMSYITMSPFFTPNVSLVELYDCTQLIDDDGKFNSSCSGLNSNYTPIKDSSSMQALTGEKFSETMLKNYIAGVENKSLGLMFRQDMAIAITTAAKSNDKQQEYVMEYKFIFSTVVGIVVVLLLISFCMDVALRSIKLAFLQLIAPIPIISYVDPKSGKDGLFKKWYQTCIKTYLSLFIRLLALYFAVYIIGKVADMKMVDIVDGSYVTNGYIAIFIIIGALMFAKQLPKILESLGVKLDGGGKFTLNPLKKFENEAIGGKKILGFGAAGTAAALAGGINLGSRTAQAFNKNNWRDENGKLTIGKGLGGVAKIPGSAIAGATSAAYRGSVKTMKGEKLGKIFSSSYGEAMFSKLKREDNYRKAGADTFGKKISLAMSSVGADVMRLTGNLNAGQQEYLDAARQDAEIQRKQAIISKNKALQTELKNKKFKAFEDAQSIGKNIDSLLDKDGRVKGAKASWENAKSRGASDQEIERLWQNYKYTKGKVLKEESSKSDSYIHKQVELYNREVDGMTVEQKDKFKKINTDITVARDRDGNIIPGNFLKVDDEIYEIKTDEYGYKYYEDKNGRFYEDNWASDAVKCKPITGVTIMGENDDTVEGEKITFESEGEYAELSGKIKELEQSIEADKAKDEYIKAHDENSVAKIANSMRNNKEQQAPGYKPSGEPMDYKFTDNSSMSNLNRFGNNSRRPSGHGRR